MHKPLTKKQIRDLNKYNIKNYDYTSNLTVLVLQDVEDPYNVGSIFRSANAFGVKKIYLTGKTPTPPNKYISHNSMGFEKSKEWEYVDNFENAIYELKSESFEIIGIELTKNSTDIFDLNFANKSALILGNETIGIYKKNLALLDKIVHIPMVGKAPSINVATAGAIALSFRLYKMKVE
jgi:tRNA G18 (ribose-2'-O)-methylase SpoU